MAFWILGYIDSSDSPITGRAQAGEARNQNPEVHRDIEACTLTVKSEKYRDVSNTLSLA